VLRVPLVMMGVVGLFVYEFEVILPLFARFTFGGNADTFGTMFAAMGLGAVVGGFYTATRGERPARALIWMAYAVGGAVTATALMPTLLVALLTLVVVGGTPSAFPTMGNAVMQWHSVPEMRGRVMSVRPAAVLGSRPLGAPNLGWIG